MARRLSAKQIRFFGTKRQRAALKRRKRPAAKHRSNPARRRAVARPSTRKRVVKRSAHRRRTKRRSNPVPQLVSMTLGNPAKRRKKAVAKTRKRRRAVARRSNAGTHRRRRHATKRVMHRRRRSNPSVIGSPMTWLEGGAGVLAGVVGTRLLPQVILAESNTGAMGYIANAITAAGLGWLAHIAFPRSKVLVGSVVAGGFAALLARIITDKTPFGAQLSLTGVGDYIPWLYNQPQRAIGAAATSIDASWMGGGAVMGGAVPDAGTDYGRRGGNC